MSGTRRIKATLWRRNGPGEGQVRSPVWTRYYAWMDTAVPRAAQLALWDGQPGDVITFDSTELGFEVGQVRVTMARSFTINYSPLVKSSPSLMKLMNPSAEQKED